MNLQIIGAMGFGILIGWYVYYINRYRPGDVQLSDIVTLIGILGGSAVLALFPAQSDLFAGYGIGLAIGFFGYFLFLLLFVAISSNFTVDWFLDGRRRDPEAPWGYAPNTRQPSGGGMGGGGDTIPKP